jgi:hypothetical protein
LDLALGCVPPLCRHIQRMTTKRAAPKKKLTKFTMRLDAKERAALEKKAASARLSAAELLRRFILGIAAALLVACGGVASSGAEQESDGGKPSAGTGGSHAGRSQSAGRGGSGTGSESTGGEPSGTGGSGSKPSSVGGSSGSAAAGDSGSGGDAGELATGGAGSDGGAAGETGEAGLGGSPDSGTGGTGIAGGGPVSCADLSDQTCGGSATSHLVKHVPKPDTYCIKVNFLSAGSAWYDQRADECSLGEPDKVMVEQGCFVVFGPAYGVHEQFWVDALYVQQENGDACVNRISRGVFDANPGNFFCSCP